MYILFECEGEWEDYRETPIKCSKDKSILEAIEHELIIKNDKILNEIVKCRAIYNENQFNYEEPKEPPFPVGKSDKEKADWFKSLPGPLSNDDIEKLEKEHWKKIVEKFPELLPYYDKNGNVYIPYLENITYKIVEVEEI